MCDVYKEKQKNNDLYILIVFLPSDVQNKKSGTIIV